MALSGKNNQNGTGRPDLGQGQSTHSNGKQQFYPKKGWDFPRRGVEVMPREILYDPYRVLGSYVKARIKPTGRTDLFVPRVESTVYTQSQEIDDRPYTSQIPYIKEQIHLKPSRDAEILAVSGKIDVPANSTAQVLRFSTFNNLRTIIKWMHYTVFDALDPEQITFQWLVDGVPLKVFACNPDVTQSGGGYLPVVKGPVATNTNCLPCLPDHQNALWEITDQHVVQCMAKDQSGFDRRVEVCAWGWIESITVWDEKVRR